MLRKQQNCVCSETSLTHTLPFNVLLMSFSKLRSVDQCSKLLRDFWLAVKVGRHMVLGHTHGLWCCAVAPTASWQVIWVVDLTLRLYIFFSKMELIIATEWQVEKSRCSCNGSQLQSLSHCPITVLGAVVLHSDSFSGLRNSFLPLLGMWGADSSQQSSPPSTALHWPCSKSYPFSWDSVHGFKAWPSP